MSHRSRRGTDIDAFFRDVDRLFAEASRSGGFMPRADIVEADDAYRLALDLPGVDADGVQVHYDDGVLTVSGERTQLDTLANARLLRAERGLGRFSRQFQIGHVIDPDAIQASLDDGVLTLHVPKAEVRRARQIQVERRATGGAARIASRDAEPSNEGNTAPDDRQEAMERA